VVNLAQRDAVLAGVEKAREEGATLVAGGVVPDEPDLANGCFIAPTVVADVRRDMSIWRDELFGPVLAVHVVDDFGEAIDAVNDSDYGLSAAVFTNSLDQAAMFRARADVGQLAINLPTSGWDVHHPFGGFALSGSAFKEQGVEGLAFYRRVKTCAVRTST
jgi:aldehyde dehydrogenase (NAD+)